MIPKPALELKHHVIILAHGNNGAPTDFKIVEKELSLAFATEKLHIFSSASNCNKTSLGIRLGGEALFEELYQFLLAIFELDQHYDIKITFIGHSLGGLYCRCAIGLLYEALLPGTESHFPQHWNMILVGFYAICSPHLGSRRPRGPSRWKNALRFGVHKVLAAEKLYGQTGRDLLLEADSVEGSPILECMCNPESKYVKGLQQFYQRTLVSVPSGDYVVPFTSASIQTKSNYPEFSLTVSDQWKWSLYHSGFDARVFLPMFLAGCDTVTNSLTTGTSNVSDNDLEDKEFYVSDNRQEVEYRAHMLKHLQGFSWRRLDILVEAGSYAGKIRLHDWPIGKALPPEESKAIEFIRLLAKIVATDHGLTLNDGAFLSQSSTEAPASTVL